MPSSHRHLPSSGLSSNSLWSCSIVCSGATNGAHYISFRNWWSGEAPFSVAASSFNNFSIR